jgi:hypothetical protein
MCLWCCWKDPDEQDLMNFFLVRFGFNVGDIDLKVISAAENSNKIQKTRFWKGKSVENVVTLEGLSFKHELYVFIDTDIAKQSSHVEFPYFVMGSHLGQQHRPH